MESSNVIFLVMCALFALTTTHQANPGDHEEQNNPDHGQSNIQHVRHKRRHASSNTELSGGGQSQSQTISDRMKEAAENARSSTLLEGIRRGDTANTEYDRYQHVNASNMLPWEQEEYEYEDPYEYQDYKLNNEADPDLNIDTEEGNLDASALLPEDARDQSIIQGPALTPNQWKDRMRAKYTRLFIIQTDILRVLGLTKQPNVTGIHISNLDAVAIDKYINSDKYDEIEDAGNAHRYQFASPSCDLPPKTRKAWRDPNHFRLYFTPEPPEHHPLVDFKMSSAVLRLYKKGPKDIPEIKENGGNKQKKSSRGGSQSTRDRSRRKVDRSKKKTRNGSRKGRQSAKQKAAIEEVEDKTKNQLRVTVNWYKKPVKKQSRKVKKQMETSQMVSRDYIGWVEIDIKQLVRRWMKRPKRNYGLEIYVEDDEQVQLNPFDVFDTINCSTNAYQDVLYLNLASLEEGKPLNETIYKGAFNLTIPNLEMSHMEIPKKVDRKKRQASQTCVKENIFVSFADLGLADYILAPQGLEAVYCKGHCAPVSNRSRYDIMGEDSNIYKECCGPTKYKPFRFLHYNEDKKLTVSTFDDLIVSECGCRE